MGILHLTSNKIKKKEKSIYINSNDQIKVFYYTSNHTLENNDRKKEKENTTRRYIHIFFRCFIQDSNTLSKLFQNQHFNTKF